MVENEMTQANLRSAFGGESQAYQRYKVWAEEAEKDGFFNVATLFNAIAHAEQIHASNHFDVLSDVEGDFLVASMAGFGIGTTVENLEGAIAGENFEIQQMYPSYYTVAEDQEESDALRSFHYAVEAEKIHSQLYSEAKEAVENGNDYDLEYVSICEVCGHTAKDNTPDKCPVCGVPSDQFKKFE